MSHSNSPKKPLGFDVFFAFKKLRLPAYLEQMWPVIGEKVFGKLGPASEGRLGCEFLLMNPFFALFWSGTVKTTNFEKGFQSRLGFPGGRTRMLSVKLHFGLKETIDTWRNRIFLEIPCNTMNFNKHPAWINLSDQFLGPIWSSSRVLFLGFTRSDIYINPSVKFQAK